MNDLVIIAVGAIVTSALGAAFWLGVRYGRAEERARQAKLQVAVANSTIARQAEQARVQKAEAERSKARTDAAWSENLKVQAERARQLDNVSRFITAEDIERWEKRNGLHVSDLAKIASGDLIEVRSEDIDEVGEETDPEIPIPNIRTPSEEDN